MVGLHKNYPIPFNLHSVSKDITIIDVINYLLVNDNRPKLLKSDYFTTKGKYKDKMTSQLSFNS